VGARVYEDVPKYMRTQLWLSLLDQQEATARCALFPACDSRCAALARFAALHHAHALACTQHPRVRRRIRALTRARAHTRALFLPRSSGARDGAGGAAPHETLDDMEALLCEGDYYGALVTGLTASNVGTAAPGEFIEDVGAVIARDISRTFPGHAQFQSAEGRARLQRVLHAYAIHDPSVGYCQGMAFVAGMLLMYLEEGRAFAALVTLMHGAALRALYLPGMAALQLRLRQLEELLRRRSPALAAHLAAHDVSPVIFASAWFLSLYAAEFPAGFAARIIDVALAERSAAVALRVALGLLDAAEEALLGLSNFEALVIYIKAREIQGESGDIKSHAHIQLLELGLGATTFRLTRGRRRWSSRTGHRSACARS
jgi:hypothetical protein